MTTINNATTILADIAEGMAVYSHQCHWLSLDATLTKALDRPLLFTDKSNRRSHAT